MYESIDGLLLSILKHRRLNIHYGHWLVNEYVYYTPIHISSKN